MQAITVILLVVIFVFNVIHLLIDHSNQSRKEAALEKELQAAFEYRKRTEEALIATGDALTDYMMRLGIAHGNIDKLVEIKNLWKKKYEIRLAQNQELEENDVAQKAVISLIAKMLGVSADDSNEEIAKIMNEIQRLTTEPAYRGAFKAIAEQQRDKIALMVNIATRQAPHASNCVVTPGYPCSCWKSEFLGVAKA